MKIADTAVLIFVVIFTSIELSSQSGTGESASSEHPPNGESRTPEVIPPSMRGGLDVKVLNYPAGHKAKYVKSVALDLRSPHPREIREYAFIPPGQYFVWASEDVAVGFWHEGPDSPGEPATRHYHDIIVGGQLGAIEMTGLHNTRQLSRKERNYVKNNHPAEQI